MTNQASSVARLKLLGSKRVSRNSRPALRRLRAGVEPLEDRRVMAAFTPGDLVVVQIGANGSTSTPGDTGTASFLDEYTPAGVFVQQIALPTVASGANNPFVLGSSTNEGQLNVSSDGQDLLLLGYDTTVGGGSTASKGKIENSTSTSIPRTVAAVDLSTGDVNTQTALTDLDSGGDPRAAIGSAATGYWLAGQDSSAPGLRYISALSTTADPVTTSTPFTNASVNVRNVEVWNGQLYFAQDKDTTNPIIGALDSSAGLGQPTDGSATVNWLPGANVTDVIPAGSGSKNGAFYFAKLGTGEADFDINGVDSGYNTLYVPDEGTSTSGAVPGLSKYTWDPSANSGAGSWDFNGTINGATLGYEGLVGSVSGNTVTFFATNPNNGEVDSIVDNSGYDGTITNNGSSTPTILFTAPANTDLRGLAIVPQPSQTQMVVTTIAANPDVAGTSLSVTVKVENTGNGNNLVSNFTGTISFSSSDAAALGLPSSYTFTTGSGGDNGQHTFTGISLVTAGSQTITALSGSLPPSSATVQVTPAALSKFVISAPADTTVNTPFSATVEATDAYGNLISGYTGTVHFTSSDSHATLPANYTFVAGDNGSHTFTNGVTLATGGPLGALATITATDTTTSAVTGSATVDDFAPQAFAPGDIVVYRVGAGAGTLSSAAAAVFLDEYKPNGTLVQSIPLPTIAGASGANQALVASGTATSEGELNLSPDGTQLLLTGYDSTVGTSSVSSTDSTSVPRVVGVVSATGGVNTTTALTDFATDGNIRGADDANGTGLYVAGSSSGVAYTTLGASTSTTLETSESNIRDVTVVNGQLYVTSQKSVRLATVGSATLNLPTTGGQALTSINNNGGFPTNGDPSTPNSFFFATLGAGDTNVDTLYYTDDTEGLIEKWSLVSGAWEIEGAISAPGVEGLTGIVSGSTVTLFATTSLYSGATLATTPGAAGTLYTYTDTAGYNAAPSGSGNATVIGTAGANEAFRGVSVVPQAIPSNSATHFVVTTSVSTSVAAGTSFNVTVTAEDAAGAAVAYTGDVHFTTSDPLTNDLIGLPADYAFNGASSNTFTGVTLYTAGTQTITAAGSIFGSATVNVTAGAATHLNVVASTAAVVAGQSYSVTVSALDAYGNLAANYAGTVSVALTGDDPAILPNYTFTTGVAGDDNGTHTFAGLNTVAGASYSQTVTATDKANSSIGGSTAEQVIEPFRAGDLAVLQVGSSTSTVALADASTAVFIDEYNSSGTLIQSIPVTTTTSGANNPLTLDGSGSSEGELNLSTNGEYLLLTGYDEGTGAATPENVASTTLARTVGEINLAGIVNTTTALTDFASGNDPRGATSADGVNIYLAGADSASGGVRYIAGLGGTTSTNLTGTTFSNARDVEIFNGQLFVSQSKYVGSDVEAVGTGLPTTAGAATITPLATTDPTLTNTSGKTNSFFFATLGSGATVDGYDTLFVADSTVGITKYSYVSGAWVSNGTIGSATVDGYEGLTGSVSNGVVTLYATDTTSTNNSTLVSIVDSSGFNGALTAMPTTIATSPSDTQGGTAFRGVAFVPTVASASASPPTVTTTSGATLATAGAAAVVDKGLTLADSNASATFSATVSITAGFQTGDTLTLGNTQGGIVSSSYNSSTGVLTVSGGSASVSQFQAALASITLTSSKTTGSRTISFTVTDTNDSQASNTATKQVSVVAPATVTGIYVRGTGIGSGVNWGTLFTNYLDSHTDASGVALGSGTLGYALRTGSTQLTPLPWSNINTITVTFSEPVYINTAAAGLDLYGSSSVGFTVPALSTNNVPNSATLVSSITWTLSGDLTDNKLLLEIPAATVTDSQGAELDGSFTNHTTGSTGSTLPSGTGLADSGDFGFQFDVLPGDSGQGIVVSSSYATAERLAANEIAGATAGYSPYFDLSGEGVISSSYFTFVRLHENNILPTAAPTTGSGNFTQLIAQAAGADSELSSATSTSSASSFTATQNGSSAVAQTAAASEFDSTTTPEVIIKPDGAEFMVLAAVGGSSGGSSIVVAASTVSDSSSVAAAAPPSIVAPSIVAPLQGSPVASPVLLPLGDVIAAEGLTAPNNAATQNAASAIAQNTIAPTSFSSVVGASQGLQMNGDTASKLARLSNDELVDAALMTFDPDDAWSLD